MTRSETLSSATAWVAMMLSMCVAASAPAPAVVTIPLVTVGPAVGIVVRNDSDKVHEYVARSFLVGRCDVNPSWQRQQIKDPRLDTHARFRLEPGAWVVKIALFSAEDANCEVESRLAADGVDTSWNQRVRLSSKYPKPEQFATAPTTFRLSASVIDETSNSFIEPQGDALQLQILVENPSDQPRVVAVVRRRLTCPTGTDFDWIVGPGDGPLEIASGPAMVGGKSWLAFSQRARGTGSAEACRALVELAELRHGRAAEQFDPPRWIAIGTVETSLRATVKADYR
jgi:hypothetical protein